MSNSGYQLIRGPGYLIRNETEFPVFVSLSQPILGPIYYEMVQPGEIFYRYIGELPVTFNIDAYLSLNGEEEFNDNDVYAGIVETFANTIWDVTTGGSIKIAKTYIKNGLKAGAKIIGKKAKERTGKMWAKEVIKYGVIESVTTSLTDMATLYYNDIIENNCLETTSFFANSIKHVEELQLFKITGGPKNFCYDVDLEAKILPEPSPLVISDDAHWSNVVRKV